MTTLDVEDLRADWVDDDQGGDLITITDRRAGATVLALPPMEMFTLFWETLGPIRDALHAQAGVPYQSVSRIVTPADLGPALRQARMEAGLTQQQLAQKVGCGVATVATAELGTRHPRLPMFAGHVAGAGMRADGDPPMNIDIDAYDGPIPGCDCEDCEDEHDFAAWETDVSQ